MMLNDDSDPSLPAVKPSSVQYKTELAVSSVSHEGLPAQPSVEATGSRPKDGAAAFPPRVSFNVVTDPPYEAT